MAKLGQKRPNIKPDISEIPKKPKVEEEAIEDPFGFDSDEESLPVSSKNVSQAKSSSQLESVEVSQSEDFASVLESNNKITQSISEDILSNKCVSFDNIVHGLKEKNSNRNMEDGDIKSSIIKPVTTDKVQNFNDDNENSHFIHKNAEDNNTINAQTAEISGYNIEIKESHDPWDSQIGKRDSPSEGPHSKGSLVASLYEWEDENEDTRQEYILGFDESFSDIKKQG